MKMIVRVTNTASAALALLQLINVASAQLVAKGCYSSPGALTDAGPYQWQSSSWCQGVCSDQGKTVMALKDGADCWCGDSIPSPADKVDDSSCSSPCQGYGQATCGGPNAWQVFLTGVDNANVGTSGGGNGQLVASPIVVTHPTSVIKTVQSKITTIKPTVVTVDGATIIRTLSQTPALDASSPSTSSAPTGGSSTGGSSTGSKVGIAVGVVVGLVALVVIIVAVVLYLKRAKKQSSHQRVSSINGGLYHGGSGAASITDSRLDPSMVERRNSIGSVFADNEDYSRRILKVTNPDGR